MNLKTRRILYSIFVAIFFLAAPPLILYTAGFRYDFTYNRIVETGSLVVRSYPEKADIYLNGQAHTAQTPTIINNILPGKIKLLIAKEGYHEWEKDILVNARVTTFEERVTLYPRTEPQLFVGKRVAERVRELSSKAFQRISSRSSSPR